MGGARCAGRVNAPKESAAAARTTPDAVRAAAAPHPQIGDETPLVSNSGTVGARAAFDAVMNAIPFLRQPATPSRRSPVILEYLSSAPSISASPVTSRSQ